MKHADFSGDYRTLISAGLWRNNPGLVQLLGLCPLLAISNTLVNGLALGLATMLTLALSNTLISCCRPLLKPEIRIPAYVLLIASIVTAVELSLQAWLPDLHAVLGVFIPLIVTNCAIIGRAESFASRHAPLPSLVDGVAHGAGFLWVLMTIGGLREWIGHGLLIALLPPGAFFVLALLLVCRNLVQTSLESTTTTLRAIPLTRKH